MLLLILKIPAGQVVFPIGATFELITQDYLWISDRSILKGTETEKGYLITTRKSGLATYRIGQIHHKVQVLPKKRYHDYSKLHKAVENSSMSVRARSSDLYVEGQMDLKSFQRLFASALQSGTPYILNVTTPTAIRQGLKLWITDLFEQRGIGAPRILISNGVELIFSGQSQTQKKYIEKLCRALGSSAQFDKDWKDPVQSVEFQLEFAEVSGSTSDSLGIQWPQQIDSQVLTGLKKQLLIQALSDRSSGRILARPTLTTRNGAQARFHSGGEFPIRHRGHRSYAVNWKPYGLTIEMKPHIFNQRVQLHVHVELSYPDGSAEIDGIPGIRRSTYSTDIEMSNQSTFFLTGLIQSQNLNSSSGISLLSRIPILGPLFSVQRSTEQSTELAVFITPRIL